MRDLRDLLGAFGRLREEGAAGALVTVMRVVGSAYRRPGARMLILPDGGSVGLVSGGCLEADLAERARTVVETGLPLTVTYDARASEDLIFGLGLGCEGKIDVLIERVPEASDGGHLARVARSLAVRERLALVTVFRSASRIAVGARLWRSETGAGGTSWTSGGDPGVTGALDRAAATALASGRSQDVTLETDDGPLEALAELLSPPPRLVLLGGGPDAIPVVRLATRLGFDVTVIDHRRAFARAERFPGALQVRLCEPGSLLETMEIDPEASVLVMSHAFSHDLGHLRELLGRHHGYLGVLGPRRRTDRMLADLAREGVAPSPRVRLHAPVGLDIGAETPEEIAVSILAEICADIAGRTGGRLRNRCAPIHGDDA